jgi:hypothetical protein
VCQPVTWGTELEALGTTWLGMHGEWSWKSWEPPNTRGGLWLEVGAYLGGETSMGTCNVNKSIEMSYNDYLAHTTEVCEDTPFVQRVSNCKG